MHPSGHPADVAHETNRGFGSALLELIRAEGLADKAVMDVGCGEGRLALVLAPEARWVIGIDWDREAIARAGAAARRHALANVEFVTADAEATDYRRLSRSPQMVVAHLCMSDRIISQAAKALPLGGPLIFAAFHTDQWKETGRISRFAYSEDRLRRVLDEAGFSTEYLKVERHVQEFGSKAQAIEALASLRSKWEADGRWAGYLAYLDGGGLKLTRSHLLVKARRR